MSVFDVQDQLLETAFDLYRLIQRLGRCREGLQISQETAHAYFEGHGRADEPPTLELALGEEIDVTIEELQAIAKGLRSASGLTDASIREEWRREREGRAR